MNRCTLWLASLLLLIASHAAAAADDDLLVEEDNVISIEYTLYTTEGAVINTNVGGPPFTYRQGVKSMECMNGVQKRLAGHRTGKTLSLTLAPEEACGAIDPTAVIELELTLVPETSRQVGKKVKMPGPHGTEVSGTVKQVKERSVVIDVNHPLAGKTLRMDVKILGITKGSPERYLLPPPIPHRQ